MKDEIFLGNVLGLLKNGKWTLSLEEASALIQIFQECKLRLEESKNKLKISDPEPIKKGKSK
jgi:hypothetical protein